MPHSIRALFNRRGAHTELRRSPCLETFPLNLLGASKDLRTQPSQQWLHGSDDWICHGIPHLPWQTNLTLVAEQNPTLNVNVAFGGTMSNYGDGGSDRGNAEGGESQLTFK